MSAASSVLRIQDCNIDCESSARSGELGGIERSRHRIRLFDLRPTDKARIPAVSMRGLEVRSR